MLKILFTDFLGKEIENNFLFKSITIDAILDIGGKLKTKKIVGEQLKDVLPLLTEPIIHIFKMS